jgi:hypothetical protein
LLHIERSPPAGIGEKGRVGEERKIDSVCFSEKKEKQKIFLFLLLYYTPPLKTNYAINALAPPVSL